MPFKLQHLHTFEAKLIFFNKSQGLLDKSPLLENYGKRCIHIWDKDGKVY